MSSTTATSTETSQSVEIAAPPSPPKNLEAVSTSAKPYYDIELNYRLDPREGGDEIIWGGTVGQMRRKYKKATVRIHDVRGHEDDFKLDVHGFQWVKHSSAVKDFEDYMAVKEGPYYNETAELMKKLTGATRVHVISHITRALNYKDTSEEEKDQPDMTMTKGLTPARFVHIDQSYDGAVRRLWDDMGAEEAAKLEKTRWAIVNLWRPLRKVTNEPLGVCDSRSVQDDELYDTMHLVPVRWPDSKPPENHMWAVAPPKSPEQHKWHYLSGMTPDEALLIKIFDSKKDGRARRVPHSAFPTPDDFGPTRASTETRCFVFWEDEEAE